MIDIKYCHTIPDMGFLVAYQYNTYILKINYYTHNGVIILFIKNLATNRRNDY
ncbi:hypothetical protein VO54_03887 [Elizabethkingia miricola]|nr:hypothetical protein VO54_03887 [Elizabethkingia miricola]